MFRFDDRFGSPLLENVMDQLKIVNRVSRVNREVCKLLGGKMRARLQIDGDRVAVQIGHKLRTIYWVTVLQITSAEIEPIATFIADEIKRRLDSK